MNKNVTFKRQHDKFGTLLINIIGENYQQSSQAINPDVLTKYGKLSTKKFLEALYIDNINNTKLTDVITDYIVSETKKTKEQIVQEINAKFSKSSSKASKSSEEDTFSSGDGIYVEIIRESKSNDPMFVAKITIKKSKNYGLVAFIDENHTEEIYRHQGLQKMGFSAIEKYLSAHEIGAIALEAQDLDGNDFNLEDAYKNLGFSKIGTGNKFIKDLGRDEFSM